MRWALLAAGLVLGLLAGGGLVTLADPGTDPPRPQPSVSSASLPARASAAPPLNPGLEPPVDGAWPTRRVRFSPTDRVLTLTGLDGLTFPVKVPLTWRCTVVERARGLSRHQCGGPADNGTRLGGELIVRDCPAPCDGPRQTAMRTAEEAWGCGGSGPGRPRRTPRPAASPSTVSGGTAWWWSPTGAAATATSTGSRCCG